MGTINYVTSIFLLFISLFFSMIGCSDNKTQNKKWQPLFSEVGDRVNYELHIAKMNSYEGQVDLSDLFEFKNDSILVLHKWVDEKAPFAIIATKQSYSNYDLKFQYKWGSRKFIPRDTLVRDAGVLFHIYDYDPKSFPRSLECQVQENDTGDLWVIGGSAMPVAEDGSDKPLEISDRYSRNSKRYHMNEQEGWNKVYIEVRGNSASFFINGQLVNRVKSATKSDTSNPLNSGYIGFQAEGAEVIYRGIMIREQ